jgi:hypothetical protein
MAISSPSIFSRAPHISGTTFARALLNFNQTPKRPIHFNFSALSPRIYDDGLSRRCDAAHVVFFRIGGPFKV